MEKECSLMEELKSYKYVICYEKMDSDLEGMLKYLGPETVCIEVSEDNELRKRFIMEYKFEKFPGLIYQNKVYYYDSAFIEKFFNMAIEETKDFVDNFVLKKGVTLFVKGTVENPKCRYTRELVETLKVLEKDIPVHEFNILEDPVKRECLKKINSWNTYPQVYLDGIFIGGNEEVKSLIRK